MTFKSILVVKYDDNKAMFINSKSIWDIDEVLPLLCYIAEHKAALYDPDLLCKELTLNHNWCLTMFHHGNIDWVFVIDCAAKIATAYIAYGHVNTDSIASIQDKYAEVGDIEQIPGTKYLGSKVWEYVLSYRRSYG